MNRLMDEVGAGGGFILAPSHHIQPDTPLENVLAVYRAVAKRRGREEPMNYARPPSAVAATRCCRSRSSWPRRGGIATKGITFDEDFFFHPAKRVEAERRMENALYRRWGRFGLGADHDKPLPVVGPVHLAAGFLLSEMLGCTVEYAADGPPLVRAGQPRESRRLARGRLPKPRLPALAVALRRPANQARRAAGRHQLERRAEPRPRPARPGPLSRHARQAGRSVRDSSPALPR